MHIPGFRSLRITPGFHSGVTRPVKSVLIPRFLSIVPRFYLGFITGYYFRGFICLERLFPHSGSLSPVSFNAIML